MAKRALLIAAALVLGLALGRLSAHGDGSPAPLLPDSPGPTRSVSGGVGVGFARTRAGAVAANANYQEAFADAEILRPGELRRRIEAVTTPEYAPTMIARNEPGTRRLAAGPIGAGLREKVATAYFGTPVLYRVVSYSPRRAVLRTWGFTVVGNSTVVEPGAYFGTSLTELVWFHDDWKIAQTRASFGPTPRLLTPRDGGEGFKLVDLLKGMRRYAVAP
jgi:hypothetical protein